MHAVTDKKKYQEITVTATDLDEAYAALKAANFQRSVSQNRVMGVTAKDAEMASANNHGHASGIFPAEAKLEWMHFIAYSILLQAAQTPDNFAVGRDFANTAHMMAEKQIRPLAQAYPAGIKVICEANLHQSADKSQSTHLVDGALNFTIETADFILPFKIDMHTSRKPHISIDDYMTALVKTLVETPGVKRRANLQTLFNEVMDSDNTTPTVDTDVEMEDQEVSTRKKF